jgi:hypothetical protein
LRSYLGLTEDISILLDLVWERPSADYSHDPKALVSQRLTQFVIMLKCLLFGVMWPI